MALQNFARLDKARDLSIAQVDRGVAPIVQEIRKPLIVQRQLTRDRMIGGENHNTVGGRLNFHREHFLLRVSRAECMP